MPNYHLHSSDANFQYVSLTRCQSIKAKARPYRQPAYICLIQYSLTGSYMSRCQDVRMTKSCGSWLTSEHTENQWHTNTYWQRMWYTQKFYYRTSGYTTIDLPTIIVGRSIVPTQLWLGYLYNIALGTHFYNIHSQYLLLHNNNFFRIILQNC